MSNKRLTTALAVGIAAAALLLLAYPVMASSTSTPSPNNLGTSLKPLGAAGRSPIALTVGQTFALTSVAGGYREVGNSAVNGTASGTLDISVAGAFKAGYALSVTGGQISVGDTTYTITGGSGELGTYGVQSVGQGQAGSAQFLFQGRNLGQFGSAHYGVLRLDLSDGSTQFAIKLLVTIAGS
jgi:hypothetical protein